MKDKKDKFVTILLSIILFIVPVSIIPNAWGQYNIIKIIVLLFCGLFLLINTLLKIDKLKVDKLDILIFIFGALTILSFINSKNICKSLIGENNRYEGLFTIITYILIYYNSKYYFKNYKKFIGILSVIYILICIFAIIQFYVKSKVNLLPIFSKGANGTFGNTNFMGSFVSIILPAFILGAILRNRKIYYLGSIVGFSAMMMCLARSSWVAFVISALAITIYIITQRKKIYWKRYFIIVIAFIMCFNFINQSDKNKKISNKVEIVKVETEKVIQEKTVDNKMGSGRIGIWKLIIKLIERVPILGCGVDALKDGLIKVCPNEYVYFVTHNHVAIDKAHNEYLQIAATIGIPALLIYVAFISMIVIKGFKKMFKHKVIAIYVIVIVSYLSQAFFNISTIGVAPIFWFILGMASRNINYTTIKK